MRLPPRIVSAACLALPGALVVAPAATDSDVALEERCFSTLQAVFNAESNWVGIHAAEALLQSGRGDLIAPRLRADAEAADPGLPRLGCWRTLALIDHGPADRARWIARIADIVNDPSAPDRKQAVESLAKLGHRAAGPTLETLRALATMLAPTETVLPLWCLHHAGDPDALPRIVAALTHETPLVRQRAGYALRWIADRNPSIAAAVAGAASREPAETRARVFLVSSALQLAPSSPDAPQWRDELRQVFKGHPDPAARYEAGFGLRGQLDRSALPELATLLGHPDGDTRVAAAGLILDILQRHETHPPQR